MEIKGLSIPRKITMADLNTKTFHSLLKLVSENPDKLKTKLNDRRLTINEKKILQSYLLQRDGHYQEAFELIDKLEIEEEEIKAQWLFLMAYLYGSITDYTKCEELYYRAIELFKLKNQTYYIMLSLVNLFNIYNSQHDLNKMKETINLLSSMDLQSTERKERALRCFYIYYKQTKQNDKALSLRKILQEYSELLPVPDKMMLFVDQINEMIELKKFNEARIFLETIKKSKKHYLKEMFKYMRILIDFIELKKPIYSYENDFKRTPYLKNQISIIKYLEEDKWYEAILYWNKLKIQYPHLYGENFKYLGPCDLFFQALQNFKQHDSLDIEMNDFQGLGKKERLKKILTDAKKPLNYEILFETIWDRKLMTKDDQQSLAKLVYRLKKEDHLEIVYKKSCYYLVTSKKTAA